MIFDDPTLFILVIVLCVTFGFTLIKIIDYIFKMF
jgi:hypothetical protein